MSNKIQFILNDQLTEIDFSTSGISPTTTVLQYLRSRSPLKGVKEGCAEGDCGACTVTIASLIDDKIQYNAFDSCLIFLPMLHGKQLITVEGLGCSSNPHPVQQAMIETDGSQCGFCTPGFIMSMFCIYKEYTNPDLETINDALTGNLCRCTGYRPIIDAAFRICTNKKPDKFSEKELTTKEILKSVNKKETLCITSENQKYLLPFSKSEALKLIQENPDYLIVNGATDIALRVTKKHELLPFIIDISLVEELKYIVEDENSLKIGAGTSMEDTRLLSKEKFPALYNMLSVFGSKQIRNKASLGGNIGSASPIGDTPPVLMAYNAQVVLENANRKRVLNLREFITGYRTTKLEKGEIITEVIIPKASSNNIIKSYKVSKRKDLDISTVSACFNLELENNIVKNINIFYGGMAAFTKRASSTENYLIGKPWKRQFVESAMAETDKEFTPISDARSGAEARRIMAKNLLLKFWSETR